MLPDWRRVVPVLIVILLPACGGRDSDSTLPAPAASVAFVDVTAAAGLAGFRHERGDEGDFWFPEINGSGAAFIDYDNDGWPDLLIAGGGIWENSRREPVPSVWLYRNERDGTFSLQTEAAGLAGVHDYSYGFAVADSDNDGDQDFLLTAVGHNRLFRNDGGRFTETGGSAGVSDRSEWSNSAAFFDADRDGNLDLFVTNYVDWSPEADIPCLFGTENRKDYCTPHAYRGAPSRYYQNDGDHTFTDQSEAAGFLPSPGKSMGVALLDFNGDRWLDLAVANDGEPDQLYRNDGDGTFSEVGFMSGMALNARGEPQAGMGIDAGQIDGSEQDAIVVGNFSFETISVFRYDGNGLFSDLSQSSGVGAASLWSLTFGILLFDVDLDGDQDLFAANGHISVHADEDGDPDRFRQPPHLFLNDGTGRFTDAVPSIDALRAPLLARGVAYADYDRDGDLDLVITENGGPVHLMRNDVRTEDAGPSYLRLTLEGTQSNRSAIGAEVRVYRQGTVQRRLVRSGSSYLSQSELSLTFGLADFASVDSLVVDWPSGQHQSFEAVAANRAYRLREGASLEVE